MDLDTVKREWTEHVLSLAADRFERRLTEELSALRVEIAQSQAGLRQELHEGLAAVRQELANVRVELLRWSFLFWLGQIGVVAGMLAFMLRALER